MCVIFFSYKQHPKYPLILLANRDEFYKRPTKKAGYWEDYPDIFAGRDMVGNGTWLGITKSGRFSAVTNYRDPKEEKRTLSRGNLVADFLKKSMPAKDYLEQIRETADKFSGFNLIVGEINADRNEVCYYSNRQSEIIKLNSGLYGLSNHFLDTPWKKVTKGKQVLAELLKNNDLNKERLFEVLSDKTLARDKDLPDTGIGYQREKLLSSIFIETPTYGTRCSTVLTFDKNFETDFEERVFVQ